MSALSPPLAPPVCCSLADKSSPESQRRRTTEWQPNSSMSSNKSPGRRSGSIVALIHFIAADDRVEDQFGRQQIPQSLALLLAQPSADLVPPGMPFGRAEVRAHLS